MWDWHADIVVAGFGGAGACAAIEAHEAGAEVIVLDRFAGGGATRFSGGVVYAGGGTRIQKEAGIEDTPEQMARYLAMEVGDAVSPALLQRYCEASSAELDWLMRHGVKFDSTFYKDKTVYPPEGYFLYYSGNEKTPAYAKAAKPTARGHRPVGTGFSGRALFDALRTAVESLNIRVLEHSPVTRLLVNRTGQVIGVEARSLEASVRGGHQALYDKVDPMAPFNAPKAARASQETARIEDTQARPIRIRARRGVILATGGYSHNLSMMREHVPLVARNIDGTMRMASLGCNGAGHRLGSTAGGVLKGMDRLYIGRLMSPPSLYLRGIMVNKRGDRFASEDSYNSILGDAIFNQPGAEARLILNSRDLLAAIKQCVFSGWSVFRYFGGAALLNILFGGTKRGGSISALARKCGIDPTSLETTVDRYNRTVGSEDEFGKLAENRVSIRDRAYWAVNFSLTNRFAFTQLFTIGGLCVDEDSGLVLRGDGRPIAGLYAAGRTAYGLCSHNYVSGLSIGDCVFSGRRAGRHAAMHG